MSVDLNPQNICGGSIYSETVIVTAAHCCKIFEDTGYNTTWFEIIAGELIFSQNSGLEQRSKIYTYLIHPDYSNHGANDICLLYLETELDFSGDDVYYIEAALSDPEPGTLCDISGWGPLEVGINLRMNEKKNFFFFSLNPVFIKFSMEKVVYLIIYNGQMSLFIQMKYVQSIILIFCQMLCYALVEM